ncbi:MAG: bifunctional DNA-formamidopyrimidine glycosylase/DNA-(apurinic or apyrimidinic site) lyase [Lentisphaeria bacterium]|nr:bifunctional DNA-formamidopyrimidine glycosylase/DNA-(apurinic or apyrimidinic site) lyase [Lentisphaeria bacterium]
MPELPEVECVRRALAGVLPGEVIGKVEVFTPAMRTPLEPLLSAGLEGRRFTEVLRRGRYLRLMLDDGRGLLAHLGMSGVIRVESGSVPRRKHEHVFLHLAGGGIFRFECPRRFSILEVGDFPELGPEPLTDDFDGGYFYRMSRGRQGALKNFLMDNHIVTGVGNIYATEALWMAGLSPERAPDSVSKRKCGELVRAVKEVLQSAIEAGGSTLHDYRHVDGSEGQFAVQLQVYGRAGEPCPRCGAVIGKKNIGGRGSAFCPRCQK